MPPEKHALLSASSASRWLVCTAAPRFEEGLPESTSSYAEEGRLAHAIGELKVLKKFTTAITPRTYITGKVPANTTFEEWKSNFVAPPPPLPTPLGSGTIQGTDAGQVFSAHVRNQNGMTQAYGDVLEQRFSGGSDEAKEAFAKFVGADSVADAAYSGTPHFDRSTGKVYLDFSKDAINPRGAGTTFFHEHGHYIDFMSAKGAGYTSTKGADFGILLRSDFDNYIKAVMQANKIKTKTDAYAFVSQELRGHITHSVSDLCGGLSKNRCSGSYGHRLPYWRNPGAVEKEAFAHMFEAQFDPDKYALMQKYFPTALAEFERLLAEVIK